MIRAGVLAALLVLAGCYNPAAIEVEKIVPLVIHDDVMQVALYNDDMWIGPPSAKDLVEVPARVQAFIITDMQKHGYTVELGLPIKGAAWDEVVRSGQVQVTTIDDDADITGVASITMTYMRGKAWPAYVVGITYAGVPLDYTILLPVVQ